MTSSTESVVYESSEEEEVEEEDDSEQEREELVEEVKERERLNCNAFERSVQANQPLITSDYIEPWIDDLLFWKSLVKTGSVLVGGLSLIKAVGYYSFISVTCACLIMLIFAAMLLRAYVAISSATEEERLDRLRQYEKIVIPTRRLSAQVATMVAAYYEASIVQRRTQPSVYLKNIAAAILLTIVGSFITANQVALIAYASLFTVPLLVRKYRKAAERTCIMLAKCFPFFESLLVFIVEKNSRDHSRN